MTISPVDDDLQLALDRPRYIDPGIAPADRTFRLTVRGVGMFVMLIIGAVGVFLGYKVFPTLHRYGASYLTIKQFNPEKNIVGISAAVVGTVVVAVIALAIAFPLAVLLALFISEYAPLRIKSLLISVVDLMAAIPSIVYAVWGYFFFMPQAMKIARWLNQYFGWLPFFSVHGVDPNAADVNNAGGSLYKQSAFVAGCVVALMVIPLASSLMRNVFAQAPIGEREGAYALGATKWGMIRSVVLPFGRGGIIGATMLGLGRALGETVAVLLILSRTFDIKFRILEQGDITISSLIADRFGDATGVQLSALLSAGFVLFLMTLVVNTLAAMIVNRSRSGAGVEV